MRERENALKEALELINLGDWSAISGAPSASLFAEEILRQNYPEDYPPDECPHCGQDIPGGTVVKGE